VNSKLKASIPTLVDELTDGSEASTDEKGCDNEQLFY